MNTSEPSLPKKVWDFFCSLKLTIALLIGLAVVSIIGTVIPQLPNIPEEYIHSLSQGKLQLYDKLGFFDMYHSWWFLFLLSLLTINLVACSIKRLPAIWKIVSQPTTVMAENLERSLANTVTLRSEDSDDVTRRKVTAILSSEFATPVVTEENGAVHLFAQKAPWARLAVYIVHLSVIVIFIGAIIGSLFGYKSYVNIPEGESVDRLISRTNQQINLGFSVLCEKFSISYYDTGAPREFKSILTVLENGKPVAGYEKIPVIVNDPLSYKGITFYQSSYGKLGEHEFVISDLDGKNPQTIPIKSGGSIKLPNGNGLCLMESTRDISQFQPGLRGPAAQVEVHMANGQNSTFIVYADNPSMNRMNAAYTGGKLLQYKGGEEIMYTGLQVAKDPGVWIVWLGCLLMVIGIYIAFFMSHRRVWVRIDGGSVTVGGNSSKNPAGFQLFFEKLSSRLKADISGEKSP